MSLMDKLRALLDDPDADGDTDETPDTLADGEAPTDTEGVAGEAEGDGTPVGDDSLESVPGDESGSDDSGDDDGQLSENTLPSGEQSPEALRDMLNNAYAIIESLRNRVAELGGDAAEGAMMIVDGGTDLEEGEGESEEDDDYSYEDDEADQIAQLKKLRGE